MKVLNAAVSTIVVVLALKSLPASLGYQDGDGRFGYTGYVAPSMDLFLREYEAFDRPAEEFELDQKLLLLLENPDCWYNQRGKKVVLLFNETNFPEEYAIIRKSRRLFGPGGRLENSFLVLEEEQERDQYMDLHNQIRGFDDSADSEKERYSYLDSYSESKIPTVKDMISEDLEKEQYKSRIKKLIRMKDNTLIKINQLSLELRNLESSFLMQCKFPECNICADFQSHLNSKYLELNKQKRRYRTIISLFREFVDHSTRFGLEWSDDKHGVPDFPRSAANHTRDWEYFGGKRRKFAQVKRPNFNLTRETYGVDHESSYRELKRLLDESERELERKPSSSLRQRESVSIYCTGERLEKLVEENEKFSRMIRSVRFFMESLYESSCPKCTSSSHNGFTRFGDILNTQMRILKYYQSEKLKLEDEIRSCIYYLENRAIRLDDVFQDGKRQSGYMYRHFSTNDYNKKLRSMFERYKEYGKDSLQFEKLVYGNSSTSRLAPFESHMCDINSLVLMNELSKEVMSRIVTSQVQKRVYSVRRRCKMCSHNDCGRCHENLRKLKVLEGNIKAQERLYKSISVYLDLCGFEQILASSGLEEPDKPNGVELEYFGRDGRLWSVEKYLSFAFIRRVLELEGQLSPFIRAKVLERIKFTLRAFIKVLELSSLSIDRSECVSCKYRQCNDCYSRFTRMSDNSSLIRSYSRRLSSVSLELERYYTEMRNMRPGHKIGQDGDEWILIRENSLREWLPGRPELVLKCDRENYSEALAFYHEVLAKRRDILRLSEHVYNSVINNSLKFSEHHFSRQVREWEQLWRDRIYYDEAFSYVSRYLSSCASRNQKVSGFLHNSLERRSEMQKLYKSLREHSETISCLIENLKEMHSGQFIECCRASPIRCGNSHLVSPEEIYRRLDSEFRAFKQIRKRLNSYIYDKHLSYYDDAQRKHQERFLRYTSPDPGQHLSRYLFKDSKLERAMVEYQDIIRSPIPGMSKYLHESESKGPRERPDTLQLSPESEYQCSKTEILVLQRLVSLLSQNQSRLNILKSLNSMKCRVRGCRACEIKSRFHDSLGKELSILVRVLNTATEQLTQCLLDSGENFVRKEDMIEFQNSLHKLLRTESSFSGYLKDHANTIRDLKCESKDIERILQVRQDEGLKTYIWIEETLTKIQKLTDEDERTVNDYVTWTHQVIQLLDFSRLLEERLEKCINTLSICEDHSGEERLRDDQRE